jgi:hypothetical protein
MDAQYIRVIDFTSKRTNYKLLVYFYDKLHAHVENRSKKLEADAPHCWVAQY